jgi:hypothetical protein
MCPPIRAAHHESRRTKRYGIDSCVA